MNPTLRVLSAHLLLCLPALLVLAPSMAAADFTDVSRAPAAIEVVLSDKTESLVSDNLGGWSGDGVGVTLQRAPNGASEISLTAPAVSVRTVHLHWAAAFDSSFLFLSDTWERSYGDLEWRPFGQTGSMPWYFLACNGTTTDSYGVMTAPGSFCYWKINATGIDLWADVRSGTLGVVLGPRKLMVCKVVARQGRVGESAYAAGTVFCRVMCQQSKLPKQAIYGFNDWYCAYGTDTAARFLTDAANIATLCPANGNKPFMVVDEGWQNNEQGGPGTTNPWTETNAKFGSNMPDMAKAIVAMNARPGLWYRALQAWSDCPPEWRLIGRDNVLDPSNPEVLQRIAENMKRFKSWGFEMVKHDYTTFDLTGLWDNQMREDVFPHGLIFYDRGHTTAEIVLNLYRTLREAGGDDMIIEGCNTFSHLSAGIFNLNRLANDTSGQSWGPTLRNGVNCLGLRSIQNRAFYMADPDCVGLASAGAVPWDKNSQWLNLVAHSGMPLFVSFPQQLVGPDQQVALRAALAAASQPQPTAEPLDWLKTQTPTEWKLDGKDVKFQW